MIFPEKPYLWSPLSCESGYSNPWICVQKYRAVNPLGLEQHYDFVHFKNKAVGVAAIEDGHIWLVGQSRFALGEYSWELPEGGCPQGEDTLDAAKRELAEETGLRAVHYAPLLQMHLSNSCTDEWGIIYLATGLTQGDASPEESEDISVLKLPFEAALKAVEAGEITDSLTVAAIYKLALMQARGELTELQP